MEIIMNFREQVARFITHDNALEYSKQADKYLWVVYNVLDTANCPTSDARVDWIEDRFDELLNA